MGIPIGVAVAGVLQLVRGIQNAVAAGRQEVSEEDIDAALAELDEGQNRLQDAIDRARQREQGGAG